MLTMGTGALLAELFVLRWEASPGFEVPLAVTAFFWSGTLAGFGALAVACLPETRLYQRLLLFFVGTLLLVMGLLQAFDVMWELKVALWGW
ncbi:MAG TPA: hypothetical protein VHQ47_12955 [Phycisphaerae bacterium]|nr:hypothetical protein [Phycisphaerae bacterium]